MSVLDAADVTSVTIQQHTVEKYVTIARESTLHELGEVDVDADDSSFIGRRDRPELVHFPHLQWTLERRNAKEDGLKMTYSI